MLPIVRLLWLGLMLTALVGSGHAAEESIPIFGGRRVTIAVPEGFRSELGRDPSGRVLVRLADAGDRHSLEIGFLSEEDGQWGRARGRRELMHELYAEYVASSREQAMQFEELEPRSGGGTYCVFTDAALIGRADLPAGEYLHLTAGVKAWPGVAVTFRLFSQDVVSHRYRELMRVLRESVWEKPVPLR
jgi:hypothetical protein